MKWVRLVLVVAAGALTGCGDNNPGGNRGRTDNGGGGSGGTTSGQPGSGGATPGSKWDDKSTDTGPPAGGSAAGRK